MNFIFSTSWNHPSLELTIRKNNVAQFIHSPWITHCFVEDLDAVRIAIKEIPRLVISPSIPKSQSLTFLVKIFIFILSYPPSLVRLLTQPYMDLCCMLEL